MQSNLTIAAISVLGCVIGVAAAVYLFTPAPINQAAAPAAAASESLVKGHYVSAPGPSGEPQSQPVPCPIWMMQQFIKAAGKL